MLSWEDLPKRILLRDASQGQLGHFPPGDSARNFADQMESAALQEARGDGGAIAARAINQQRPVVWQSRTALAQMIQGNAQAPVDEPTFLPQNCPADQCILVFKLI